MISIAIDGPVGAGKSTIAKEVAKRLGYIYVDTGALYRTVALYLMRQGVNIQDEAQVQAALPQITVEIQYRYGEQQVLLNGENVTGQIRGEEISQMAASVSALPCVRSFLLGMQRELAEKDNIVMDGRDIGTVVLPHAQIKIFLTASAVQRAKRRYEEYREKGIACDYDEILSSVMERDLKDTTRSVSPLKQAADAELIDTTYNTLEQSIVEITAYVNKRLDEMQNQ